jgi:hypothetical protein
MTATNQYLQEVYMPVFDAEFMQPATEEGTTFAPWIGGQLTDILCEYYERVVGDDNHVRLEGLKLQKTCHL